MVLYLEIIRLYIECWCFYINYTLQVLWWSYEVRDSDEL